MSEYEGENETDDLVSADLQEEQRKKILADHIKDEGNSLLASHKFAAAAEKYSAAITLFPNAIYYSNRAQALIKLESYAYAVDDANEAIKLDPKYVKAYYRRGNANFAMGKLKEAKADFKAVIKIVPNDSESLKKVKVCEKALRERALSEALDFEDSSVSVLDVSKMVVDESYKGPRLENGLDSLTIDFIQQLMQHFKEQKLLHRKYVLEILFMAKDYLKQLPSLLRVSLPSSDKVSKGEFKVCGDTHGQYYDLLNIFEIGGFPSEENPYLFNGDFVDRGSFSFENVFVLLCLMIAIPKGVYLLRGNHETKNMNQIYGFAGEVRHKYDESTMRVFTEVFNWLPLAAVLQDKIFITHGGLSTQDEGRVTLSEIENISRNREPPESGLMSDLLWSDPNHLRGRQPSKRGIGFNFGPDYTENFLKTNSLKLVVRSHEVMEEGYSLHHDGKCITVFSAPNYCDQMGNKGAFICFSDDLEPRFVQFTAVPHPNVPCMRYAANMFGL